jgi:capsule polysaccharide export protein KpsE/RkpR
MERRYNPGSALVEQRVSAETELATSVGLARHEQTVERLRLAWSQRSFLFRVTLYSAVIATVIAFLIPNRYTSVVRLMPPDSSSSSGLASVAAALTGRSGSAGEMAGDLLGIKSTSDSFVGILSSRTAQDQLIQQFDLQRLYHDRRMEDTRKDLADHTDFDVDRKSQIVTIQVTDKNAKRAAAMAQAYVDQLNRLVAQLSTSSARRERIFLEERLAEVNRDLESAEKEFSQFASKNTAIDVPAQARAMVESVAVLQGQLIAAQSEVKGLKQIYADNNVRLRSAEARVAELQGQLNRLGGQDLTSESTGGNEFLPSIRKLPLLGVPYADLYRSTKVQEAVFETLTQQYEIAKVQEAKEIPTVKVLDPPNIPDKRSFPPHLLIAVLGTFFGFWGGVSWIFASAIWQHTDSADPRKIFAREVVSTIRAGLPAPSKNGKGHSSS